MENLNFQKIKEFGKEKLEFAKTNFNNYQIITLCIIILIILVVSTIFYIYHKITLNERNCQVLKKVYTQIPPLSSITDNQELNKCFLRDFYVKSAYNACSPGNFKNDFVNLCALSNCISQGVRFLDFEIYSINDQPVVATSSVLDYTVKETYNYIPLASVFERILNEAFSSGTCPNFRDPLILHFRIMSNNCKMYTNFANLFVNNINLNSRTLGKKYSYEFSNPTYGSLNLGRTPIKDFSGKIIISIDSSNPLFRHTPLDEYVNIASGSPFLRIQRYTDVKLNQDMTFTEFNKKNMSIVLPDLSANDTNPSFNVCRAYGCQFVAMSFQNYDVNLEQYNDFFDGNRSAFVIKPDNQRFIPLTIPKPPPQNPDLSYETRDIKSDFYSYNI